MKDPSSPIRILLIRTGRLGDTIWSTSVIGPLIEHFGPDVTIDMLVMKGMKKLLISDSRISTIFELSRSNLPLFCNTPLLKIILSSYAHPYSLTINLETGSKLNRFLSFLRTSNEFRAGNFVSDCNTDEHYVIFLRNILSKIVPISCSNAATPHLMPPTDVNLEVLMGKGKKYICLHPGNSQLSRNKRSYRQWPVEHWQNLAFMAVENLPDIQVVIIGERSETELCDKICSIGNALINLCGRTSLTELMAVIASAELLVTTDTGPSHMAAALQTPVVALFGPSNFHNTGPFVENPSYLTIITSGLPCSPCVNTSHMYECGIEQCMKSINPNTVFNSMKNIMYRSPNIN